MTTTNFKIAFTVGVSHTYFDQDTCTCLQFKPGEATTQLLTKFDLKMRHKINGFDFFVNSRSAIPAFFDYVKKTANQPFFDFGMITTDARFNAFTNLPVDWMGQLEYDSRSASNIYKGGNLQLVESYSTQGPVSYLGKLSLYFDDIIKYSGDNQYARFSINYTARATQWQYFIINKSQAQLDNPTIAGKMPASFDGPENIVIESGDRALLFSSAVDLPLSQIPVYKFDLVNRPVSNGGGNGGRVPNPKIIVKGLPNPDPARIDTSGGDNIKRVSSPMYVFV
jgi:hypothetical protein